MLRSSMLAMLCTQALACAGASGSSAHGGPPASRTPTLNPAQALPQGPEVEAWPSPQKVWPHLTVAFPAEPAAGEALALTEAGSLSMREDVGALHGASGMTFVSPGRLLVVSDREAALRQFAYGQTEEGEARASTFDQWGEPIPLRGEGPGAEDCAENLEAVLIEPQGQLLLASDGRRVGQVALAEGAQDATVRCSAPASASYFPVDSDPDNDGFETLFWLAGAAHVFSEKGVSKGADVNFAMLRVDHDSEGNLLFDRRANLEVRGGASRQMRLSDGLACEGRLFLLGSYQLPEPAPLHASTNATPCTSKYRYFLLTVALQDDSLGAVRWHTLDNGCLADHPEAGPPNIEGLASDDGCKTLLVINDDSIGGHAYFPRTVLRRIVAPAGD